MLFTLLELIYESISLLVKLIKEAILEMRNKRFSQGFTLIELVVVIAILGIFAGIAIPQYLDFTAKTRGSRIVADLQTLDRAAAVYAAKTGVWPNVDVDGTGSDVLTTDDSAHNKYPLLAEWPVPPNGESIIFPSAPDVTVTLEKGEGHYVCQNGAIVFKLDSRKLGWTAAQLAVGGDANLKNTALGVH